MVEDLLLGIYAVDLFGDEYGFGSPYMLIWLPASNDKRLVK